MKYRVTLVIAAGASAACAQPQFAGIGFLPDQDASYLFDLSADGSTAAGWGDGPASYTQRPFRWTRKGGLQEFGNPILDHTTKAYGVSADGAVVVGSDGPFQGGGLHAFVSDPGMRDLGVASNVGLAPESIARAVSADGTIVCGQTTVDAQGHTDMFLWTAAGGMVRIGDAVSRGATDISAAGDVVVGFTTLGGPGGPHRATRWSAAAGFQELAGLPGTEYSAAESVSQDGRVIVGACSVAGSERIVRWDGAGARDLGQLFAGVSACAYAVSGDGTVIGGRSGGCCYSGQYHAFLWTEAGGLRNLNTWLPALGIDLGGWRLTSVRGISADGRTIAGTGEHNGASEGWVATLPAECYPDCNADGLLSLSDFGCFQTRFALASSLADCDADGALTLSDFGCFQSRFVLGCP